MTRPDLSTLANDLIATRCFDIPALILLLHDRVNQERRLQMSIARLRVPPLAKPNLPKPAIHKE
jgi:hypothetical protein